nr:hypothetical protein [Tanacetum cinerariifolium]
MSLRQFILALKLYTPEEMNNNLFEPFREACFRNMPTNYNPTEYFIEISTRHHYDTQDPPSYTLIKNPIHRLVHRLLTLSVVGRHNAKEKVTLDDLFLLYNMDEEEMVDVPWNETLLLNVARLVDLGICRYNELGLGELVDDQPDNSGDEAAVGDGKAQGEERDVRRHPNMTFTNRLRAMDERLGKIETYVSKLSTEVEDLIYVVFGMSEQYDEFYEEFG